MKYTYHGWAVNLDKERSAKKNILFFFGNGRFAELSWLDLIIVIWHRITIICLLTYIISSFSLKMVCLIFFSLRPEMQIQKS